METEDVFGCFKAETGVRAGNENSATFEGGGRKCRGFEELAVQELLDTRHVERLVLGNSSREIAELLAVFGYHDYSKLGRMQVLTYI
jgi:hypothetical protein